MPGNRKKKNKTPRGAGYTVRVSGKKVYKTSLLEEQFRQVEEQYRELLRHNELLRDKEAFQLAMLESCELGLHHMSTAAATQAAKAAASGGSGGDGGSSSSSHQQMDQKVMSAALLDMQAAELMRVLQPPSSSSQQPSTQPDSSQQQQMQSPQQPGQLQLQRSNSNSTATSSSGLTGSNACSSSTSADTSGSGPEWPAAAAQHNRMKRLLASVTPADVQGVHGLSAEEYAERFKPAYAKLRAVRQETLESGTEGLPELNEAVEAVGKLLALSLVSDEDRHCRLIGMNFDTMRNEAPPAELWSAVVEKANLLPEQLQHLSKCFLVFAQQRTCLLQEQQQIVQQLQGILGAETSPQQLLSASTAAAAAALAQSRVPSHFLSQLAGAGMQDTAPAGWPFGPAQQHSMGGGKMAAAAAGLGAHNLAAAAAGATDSQTQGDSLLLPPLDADLQQQPPGAASATAAAGAGAGAEDAGVLSLEDAEKVEELLQGVMRITRLLKQHGRQVAVVWINLLTAEQHADAMLAAWPWLTDVGAVCRHIMQRQQHNAPKDGSK